MVARIYWDTAKYEIICNVCLKECSYEDGRVVSIEA